MSAYLHTMSFSFALLTTMLWPAAPAHAWGILLSRDGVPVEITEVNALFIVGEDSTTVHLKTHFDGVSEDFVWLVPVPSTSKVELSHNDIFERLDEETWPRYNLLLDLSGVEMWSEENIKERFGFVPELTELALKMNSMKRVSIWFRRRFFQLLTSLNVTSTHVTPYLWDGYKKERRAPLPLSRPSLPAESAGSWSVVTSRIG